MRTRFSPSSDSVSSPEEHLGHRSVLLHDSLKALEIQPDDIVVDATLGGAGHAQAIAAQLESAGCLIGFDMDHDAIQRAQTALASASCRTEIIEANFRTMGSALVARDIPRIDKALFDLGWSSYQLGVGRGFSFQADEPLLMTYTKEPDTTTLTAGTIVNEWEEESIADVLYGWGEERYSRHIARAIVTRRAQKPFTTSRELAEVIKESVPSRYRFGRIHPATKTFQALRIAVNDELGSLREGMLEAWELLNPGGRIAVITFHSIEDRIVKQQMVAWEKEGSGTRVTKKPLPASPAEIRSNPRARSAKLRVIEKTV